MPAWFVTGTGTDVGKTFITQGLVRHFRGQDRVVNALKPVISGFDAGNVEKSDTGMLLQAMGEPVSAVGIERVSPWRFSAPLSPDMAAAGEHRKVPFDEVVAHSRHAVARAGDKDLLFIEGVGGVRVPLVDRFTVCEWMEAVGVPLILVAGSYVGAISHTLAAVDAVKQYDLRIAALIVNESPGSPATLAGTVASIERFVNPIKVVALRHMPHSDAHHEIFGELAATLL